MKILIDIMIVMLIYTIGYKMSMDHINKLWRNNLKEMIQEELERERHKINKLKEQKDGK